ncbi:MAG: type IV secretory system conjugative DNA transfer family protein [Patescibacteria group bacterium]
MTNLPFQIHIYLPIILVIIGLVWFLILRRIRRKDLEKGLNMSLFLIRLPKYEQNERKLSIEEIRSLIGKMEQFYSNFLYLEKKSFFGTPPEIAFEVSSQIGGSDISFFVSVPDRLKTSLDKYVQGIFPGAVLQEVPEDYTIFEPGGVEKASYLQLKKHYGLPIKTYKELENDPLESITNSLTKITKDEGSSIQLILKPTSFSFKRKINKIQYLIKKKGLSFSQATRKAERSFFLDIIKEFFDILLNSSNDKEVKEDQDLLEAIKKKGKHPAFEANVRLVAAAKQKEKAEDVLNNLESGFSQFFSNFNGFRFKRVKGRHFHKLIDNYSFRRFNKKEKMVLNLEELSSIYHFPLSHMKTPYINWVKTKESAPPSNLPENGPVLIGNVVFRGEGKDVYIGSREDRRRHVYTIGQTGVGKTSLMQEMIRQDMENGEGVGVIDPHGDLIEDTLANVPKNRIDDVVLFEPFDTRRPCGLNMLEWDIPEQKDFAVSEMISIFTQLFPPEMIGPMFEHYMRNAMLALMADKENPGTLVEIPKIFTDDDFMREKVSKVSDPMVRNFWEKEWQQTVGEDKSKMLGYVVSKVGRFVENEMMRNIIGQQHSSFDLSKVMDEGKIFLVNLTKGLTGEMNSSLLGLILVSKLQMAAMKRVNTPQEQRKDFYLYIDEFQNFTTDSIATILSEARKYKLNLILANQFMPQLKDEIRDAVIGNVGTIAAYRVGEDDAEFLENKFSPEFSSFDLSNISNYHYITKMIVDGNVTSPFKVKAPYPQEGDKGQVKSIKKLSKQKYGRPKKKVENRMKERGIV